MLSGVQPTGTLHLGNYLGAIRNWVKMQELYGELCPHRTPLLGQTLLCRMSLLDLLFACPGCKRSPWKPAERVLAPGALYALSSKAFEACTRGCRAQSVWPHALSADCVSVAQTPSSAWWICTP